MLFNWLFHAIIVGLFLQHFVKSCSPVPKGEECSKVAKPTVSAVCAAGSAAGSAGLCVILPIIGCVIGAAAGAATCKVVDEVTGAGKFTFSPFSNYSSQSIHQRMFIA